MTTTALTSDRLQQLQKEFEAEPRNRLMQNAITSTAVTDIALDRSIVISIDHTMSNLLDDWKVTNQKKSGRCWLFSGLNLLRSQAAKVLGVKDFEFSQNYLLFWDKLEKANYLFESIIDTADRDLDDRTVAHLLADPIGDGGQWNMFVALIRKHGLVPKSAMPETQSSSETAPMNDVLATMLRQGARDLRALSAEGADAMRARKEELLVSIHRVLSVHLGTPPSTFLWQWTDEEKNFHRDGPMTPQDFAARYTGLPLDAYVCIVHDPRESSPVGRVYTVEYLGNVMDAPRVTYLNVEMPLLKELAMGAIVGGEPVWFGCDTGKMMNRDLGLWDAALYDFAGVYGTTFDLTKAERLLHGEAMMTHAMLFTGVDVVDGAPRKWRVENSWGDEKADQGFYTMNDSWFAEHVFEIAVRRDRLPEELQAVLEDEPIVLPAWDPMGALARQ